VDAGDYAAVWRSMLAAFRYRPSRMELQLVVGDGGSRTLTTRALLVAVANGPFLGAGFTVAPDAALDDGLLDVRIFRHYSKKELFRHFAAIAFGRRAYAPHTDTERAARVTIKGHRPLPARADGVDLGHTPVTFGVRAGSLLVVAPPPDTPPDPPPAHRLPTADRPGGSLATHQASDSPLSDQDAGT
jgi:diacylglycerol kinase family enzyme